MTTQNTPENIIRALCQTQRFAVLATARDNRPHTSLMAFAVTPDLRAILIATDRATRKYRYLAANKQVSMLIDNCTNRSEDVTEGITITVTGQATELHGTEREGQSEYFLSHHPNMVDFVHSPTCALVRVDVTSYQVVTQFHIVQEWQPPATQNC